VSRAWASARVLAFSGTSSRKVCFPSTEWDPPGLDHGQHGLRQGVVLALRHRADQLEHLSHEPLAGLAAELLEADLLDVLALRQGASVGSAGSE
jgi:hypothetical protein